MKIPDPWRTSEEHESGCQKDRSTPKKYLMSVSCLPHHTKKSPVMSLFGSTKNIKEQETRYLKVKLWYPVHPSINLKVGYLLTWTNKEVTCSVRPHEEHEKSRISGNILNLISRRKQKNQKGRISGPSLNIFMVGYLNVWTNEEVAGRARPHKEHKKSRISGRMLKLISRRIPTENLKRSFTCSPEQTRKSPAVPGSTKNIMYRLHISSPDLAPIRVSVFRPRLSYVHLNTGNLKPISTL
mgnify:CR=1 FL=1